MRGVLILVASMCLIMVSCDQIKTMETNKSPNEKVDKKKRNGEVISKHANGKVRSVVNYKDGVKHGIAKDFYETGVQRLEINYQDGKKHGQYKMFYEDGTLYKEANYLEDRLHGVEKVFRENGTIMSEAPFKNGFSGLGLKEYTTKNKERTRYGEIVVKEIDKTAFTNEMILEFSLSEKVRELNFMVGELEDGKFLHNGLEYLPMKNNIGSYTVMVPKGQYIMGKFNVVASYKTNQGNICVLQRTYNLSVNN